jgi:hypothetical protein
MDIVDTDPSLDDAGGVPAGIEKRAYGCEVGPGSVVEWQHGSWLSVFQLSAIGYRLSAISYQLSVEQRWGGSRCERPSEKDRVPSRDGNDIEG